MKRILAYGGGINSTAILALILRREIEWPDRIIFCDTGAEKPETICYVKKIKLVFPKLEIITGKYGSLIDYCRKYRIFPYRQFRWCTDKFKIRPHKEAAPEEHTKILGIDYGEQHRVKDHSCEYPLIDLKLNRNDCLRIIREIGWPAPVKSGCFICPYMRKAELVELAKKNPEQFQILVELEKTAHDRHPKMYFKGTGKLIPEYIGDDHQEMLDGFDNYQHCLCKYD